MKGRWRCVSRFAKYWTQPTFNDNAWPVAKISRGPNRRKSSIDASAKWIWGHRSQKLAYCRAFLSEYIIGISIITRGGVELMLNTTSDFFEVGQNSTSRRGEGNLEYKGIFVDGLFGF